MLHWKPLLGNFQVQLGISQGALLETFPEIGRALALHVVQHSLGNETAAVAFWRDAVQDFDGRIRQHDVNTLAHTAISIHTKVVYGLDEYLFRLPRIIHTADCQERQHAPLADLGQNHR